MRDQKTNKMIKAMSIIGIILSLAGLLYIVLGNIIGFLMLGAIPLFTSILFLKTKNPIYGIVYTVFFLLNRAVPMMFNTGTLLGTMLILAMLAFFIYVDYRSCIQWKEMKNEAAEPVEGSITEQ